MKKKHKLNLGALTYINISPFPNLTKKHELNWKKDKNNPKKWPTYRETRVPSKESQCYIWETRLLR